MVEAAAKAMWEADTAEIAWPPSEEEWDDAEVMRATARTALEAIEPMIEKLIEDACDEAITNDRWEMDGRQ